MGTSNLADKENGYTKLKGLQYKMLKANVVFLVFFSFWQMSAATPVGTKTAAAVAGAAAIGIAIDGNDATDCDDVGIDDNACAALYDEENCDRRDKFKILRNGDQGVLPYWSSTEPPGGSPVTSTSTISPRTTSSWIKKYPHTDVRVEKLLLVRTGKKTNDVHT